MVEQLKVAWKQGHDEHTWNATLGNVYKLRVFPGFKNHTIHYHAQVCNILLDELAVELCLPTVEVAMHRAIYLAWQHNYAVGDALLTAI